MAIFDVFGVKFSDKKSIFQNCPIKRAGKAILKNRFFGRKCHSINLKNDQIEVVGHKFLNALYVLEWDQNGIYTYIDGVKIMDLPTGNGFCDGQWWCNQENNPWNESGSLNAPFDQDFYLIINLAVGGDYFPNNCENLAGPNKPWENSSGDQKRAFWWGGADEYNEDRTSVQTWSDPTLRVKDLKVFKMLEGYSTTQNVPVTTTAAISETACSEAWDRPCVRSEGDYTCSDRMTYVYGQTGSLDEAKQLVAVNDCPSQCGVLANSGCYDFLLVHFPNEVSTTTSWFK